MKRLLAFAFVIIFWTNPALAALRYNVTDLGTLPGYDISHAWSINNNAQIVGEAYHVSLDIWRAVLFDSTGAGDNVDLGTLGGTRSAARAVNNQGQIVGSADSDDLQISPHATMFDSNAPANNVPLADESAAFSINDDGKSVGYRVLRPQDGNNPIERANLFDPNHEANSIDVGALNGYRGSVAVSINNNGQIVGFSHNDMFTGGFRATLFDPNGTGDNIDLGTLGGQTSLAFSINGAGRIVGSADTAAGYRRATLFDPTGDGDNLDLGTMPGYDESAAFSINNNGQIAGLFYIDPYQNDHRAMIFDPTGNADNIDLNTLIDPALGWVLVTANCINDRGWIVGSGTNPQGKSRAFVLWPAAAGDSEPDRDVDLRDFAVFAAAWKSNHYQENYSRFCDIAVPEDGIIDELDLAVFAGNYMNTGP
ncbi:MAG: DUF3466 family protein [Planctomycetota bacterium]|jgi:uncharacterized membrane protein